MSQEVTSEPTTSGVTNVSPSATLVNNSQGNELTNHLSSLETLQECAQQLIEEINAKRQRDATILSELKSELDSHATSSFQTIEKFILDKSQAIGDQIQTKLHLLFNTLKHVAELKSELEQFRNTLEVLNSDTQKTGLV